MDSQKEIGMILQRHQGLGINLVISRYWDCKRKYKSKLKFRKIKASQF